MSIQTQLFIMLGIICNALIYLCLSVSSIKKNFINRVDVTFTATDQYREFYIGDTGYIIGWVTGGDGAPYAAIATRKKVVLAKTMQFEITKP